MESLTVKVFVLFIQMKQRFKLTETDLKRWTLYILEHLLFVCIIYYHILYRYCQEEMRAFQKPSYNAIRCIFVYP